MPHAYFSRTRSAFTLVESLVMLVLLSTLCMVAFAVVKAKWIKSAPPSSVKNPQVAPPDSNTGGDRPSGIPRKELRDGATEDSASQSN